MKASDRLRFMFHAKLRSLLAHERVTCMLVLIAYIVGAFLVAHAGKTTAAMAEEAEMLPPVIYAAMHHLFVTYMFAAGGLAAWLRTKPLTRRLVASSLESIGFTNRANIAPVLRRKRADKDNPNITVWTFETNGIPLKAWDDRRAELETALGVIIVRAKYERGNQRVVLYTVPAESDLPDYLPWKDEYLSDKSFVLMLGKGYAGPVSVNLADIPHILLGGSTGSGKTILMKVMIRQAIQKGAEVAIVDFKGGVDFPPFWRDQLRICYDNETVLALLDDYIAAIESRKTLLFKSGQSNIDEYNLANNAHLPRYILACDEIAEMLDKTGMPKERKEQIGQIESRLSVIARQGRAFGVHLILATQRPDANVLSGQIRNNINCRICGRADNVLSQIILDSTSAADQIPKEAKGRFLLHDGTVFQGFWLDEGTL